MTRHLLCLLCLMASLAMQAQGISFEEGKTFAQVLAKAKAEKKNVFMDCYTTWCGPCRLMAKEEFPKKEMGDWMNPRFVSVKMDMEKGEGKELAKKYDVNAYPTLLLLDSEGKVLCRMLGYKKADDFIKEAEQALEGKSSALDEMKKQYAEGDRSADFLLKYLAELKTQRMNNESRKVMTDYLKGKTSQLLTDTLGFRFFNELYHDPHDPLFLYVYDHKDDFIRTYGPLTEERLWRVWFNYPEMCRFDENRNILTDDGKKMDAYVELMKQHKVNDYTSIQDYYRLFLMSLKGDYSKTLDMADKYGRNDRVWDLGLAGLCSQIERYVRDSKQRQKLAALIRFRLKALEGVKDLPEENELYYVDGRRVGPIERSRIYYRGTLTFAEKQ